MNQEAPEHGEAPKITHFNSFFLKVSVDQFS